MRILIILLCISLSMGIASSATLPNYLGASKSDVSPAESARIGQPIVATMTLKKVNLVPDEATLKIVTDLDEPRLQITWDNETQECGLKECIIGLPSEGVDEINIRIDGFAPKVEKLTDIKVLDVVTNVQYKGEDAEDQAEGTITLSVSNREIRETTITIEDTEDKLRLAESKVKALKDSGINTVELEAELQNARDLLANAQTLHEREEIDLAKSTAESSSKILDGVILKSEKEGSGTAPVDIKRYIVIAGAVIFVLVLALIIKGKREELG